MEEVIFEKLDVGTLKKLNVTRGLPSAGKKSELIDRLIKKDSSEGVRTMKKDGIFITVPLSSIAPAEMNNVPIVQKPTKFQHITMVLQDIENAKKEKKFLSLDQKEIDLTRLNTNKGSYSLAELKTLAKKLNLPVSGTRNVLIERIKNAI